MPTRPVCRVKSWLPHSLLPSGRHPHAEVLLIQKAHRSLSRFTQPTTAATHLYTLRSRRCTSLVAIRRLSKLGAMTAYPFPTGLAWPVTGRTLRKGACVGMSRLGMTRRRWSEQGWHRRWACGSEVVCMRGTLSHAWAACAEAHRQPCSPRSCPKSKRCSLARHRKAPEPRRAWEGGERGHGGSPPCLPTITANPARAPADPSLPWPSQNHVSRAPKSPKS